MRSHLPTIFASNPMCPQLCEATYQLFLHLVLLKKGSYLNSLILFTIHTSVTITITIDVVYTIGATRAIKVSVLGIASITALTI
jgi:hypothetical protein